MYYYTIWMAAHNKLHCIILSSDCLRQVAQNQANTWLLKTGYIVPYFWMVRTGYTTSYYLVAANDRLLCVIPFWLFY